MSDVKEKIKQFESIKKNIITPSTRVFIRTNIQETVGQTSADSENCNSIVDDKIDLKKITSGEIDGEIISSTDDEIDLESYCIIKEEDLNNIQENLAKSSHELEVYEDNDEVFFDDDDEFNDKSRCIINELLETEKSYIISLKTLIEVYQPLIEEKCGKYASEKIFGNIKSVYNETQKFYAALVNCNKDVRKICETFLNFDYLFKLYEVYSMNKPMADKHSKLHLNIIQDIETKYNDSQFQNRLHHPIRRLAGYILLLKRLKSANVSGTDQVLSFVLKKMDKCNAFVAVGNIEKCPINWAEQGDLILFNTFKITRRESFEGMVFLFEKIIVITKTISEKHIFYEGIPIQDLRYAPVANAMKVTNFSKSKYDKKSLYSLENDNLLIFKKWNEVLTSLLKAQYQKTKALVKEMYDSKNSENNITTNDEVDNKNASNIILHIPNNIGTLGKLLLEGGFRLHGNSSKSKNVKVCLYEQAIIFGQVSRGMVDFEVVYLDHILLANLKLNNREQEKEKLYLYDCSKPEDTNLYLLEAPRVEVQTQWVGMITKLLKDQIKILTESLKKKQAKLNTTGTATSSEDFKIDCFPYCNFDKGDLILYSNNLELSDRKPVSVFLYSNILILSEPDCARKNTYVFIDHIRTVNLQIEGKEHNEAYFVLTDYPAQKSRIIRTPDIESKQKWIKSIEQLLWMQVKAAKDKVKEECQVTS